MSEMEEWLNNRLSRLEDRVEELEEQLQRVWQEKEDRRYE